MPQTSVPDNAVMKNQQAQDAPAKTRSKSRPAARSPAKSGASSNAAKAGKKAASAKKSVAKPKSSNSQPNAAPAPAASGQGEIRPAAAPKSAARRQDTGSSWSLGKLLRIFSRSKGENALEKQVANSLGKQK